MMTSLRGVASRVFGGRFAVSVAQLRKMQLVLGGLLAAQGAAVLLFGVVHEAPIYIAYLTGDTLQTNLSGGSVVAPAIHELIRVNLSYPVAAGLFVAAAFYLLLATVWRQRYEAWLKKDQQPLNWAMITVLGCLMVVTTGLQAGVSDVATLAVMVAFLVLLGLTGWSMTLLPGRRSQNRTLRNLVIAVAIIAAVMPWLTILRVMCATSIFGSVSVPAYLWWLAGTTIAGWILAAVNMHLTAVKRGRWAQSLYGERWFITLVFVVETAFAWQVFAAVLRP